VSTRVLYILAAVVLAGFAVLASIQLIDTSDPLVTSVSALKSRQDRPVRFVGSLVPETVRQNEFSDELFFKLRDTGGEAVGVHFRGMKPSGLNGAVRITVRGTFRGDEFYADRISVVRDGAPRGD
jgi:cytochrome c-type biogenesis protein CcmE